MRIQNLRTLYFGMFRYTVDCPRFGIVHCCREVSALQKSPKSHTHVSHMYAGPFYAESACQNIRVNSVITVDSGQEFSLQFQQSLQKIRLHKSNGNRSNIDDIDLILMFYYSFYCQVYPTGDVFKLVYIFSFSYKKRKSRH